MKPTIRKAIVITLLALCASTLGFTIFLDEHFYWTRPRKPEPQSGRIYPELIHHGTVVYLTRTEKLPFDYFLYFFVGFALAAHVLNQRWRCIPPFTK